jgi:hypothetical protein
MAGKKQTSKIKNVVKIKCQICGKERGLRNYYASNKGEYKIAFQGKAPFCSDCLKSMIFDENGQVDRDKFINVLVKLDKPMIPSLYGEVLLNEKDALSNYTSRLNLKADWKSLTYADSFRFNEVLDKPQKNENDVSLELEMNEDDLKSQKDVIRLLGYDPFAGYEKIDKKFLYNELIPYLDEDTLEDQFKCNVILQIVNNNNQIRKIDMVINKLSSNMDSLIKNSEDIKKLTAIKTQLNQANDKLSKENNIALKHRAGSNAKNSTLGSMMKNLRELGFEKAEHDYYDMSKAYGMKVSADISNKSIMEILHFDENEFNIMFKMQREEIQKLQEKELNYKEEIRKLAVENNLLKETIKKSENN